MFTSSYWKKLGERTVVVFSASLGGILGADSFELLSVDSWQKAVLSAGLTALVAALVSIGGGRVTSSDSPALTSKVTENIVK